VRVAVSDVFPQLPTVSIGVTMAQRFVIDDIVRRQYRRFKVVGTQFTARLLSPSDKSDPVGHFLASVNDLFRARVTRRGCYGYGAVDDTESSESER